MVPDVPASVSKAHDPVHVHVPAQEPNTQSRCCQASCCENHVIHSAPEEPLILPGHEGAQAPQPDGGVEVVFSAISQVGILYPSQEPHIPATVGEAEAPQPDGDMQPCATSCPPQNPRKATQGPLKSRNHNPSSPKSQKIR